MDSHPLFALGGRLRLCASMVREGAALADIGTDHGYLPIWLARRGLISRAVAADVRPGPLEKARGNIERYRVHSQVAARLSDGLNAVSPAEADDIVIAGMGGEMMIRIISEAPWLKDAGKHLILQPMTSAKELRVYLARQGFAIVREQAVVEDGRVYSVILARYSPESVSAGGLYPYIGGLDAENEDNRAYLRMKIRSLKKREAGLKRSGREAEAAAAGCLLSELNAMLEKRESNGNGR